MRVIFLSVCAGGALLAMMTAAQADPVTIGTALATGIGSLFGAASAGTTVLATIAGSAITVGQAVGAALSLGASLGLSLLGARRGRQPVNPAETKSNFSTAEGPELRAVGRVMLGGLKLFGNTQTLTSYRLIAHCRGPIDGVEAHFLGNREVIVEPNGEVSSPPYTRPGGSYVTIRHRDGAGDPPAWSQLQTAFPSLWTAAHRVRGVAQTLVEYLSPGIDKPKWSAMYQGGFPEYQVEARGERVYDPRTGATVWSDNGILVALHVALSAPELSLADFDLPLIAAEATRADAPVATLTGTEPRARAWGVFSSEETRSDTLTAVLQSIGAEQVWTLAGKIGFRLIDDDRPAEATIAERDIVSLALNSGPESVERPNRLVLRYYSPERRYEMAEIDLSGAAWARDQGEIDRTGKRELTIDLRFCPSASQAQRIARRLFALARADGGLLKTNLAGLAAWNARTLGIVSAFGPMTVETDPPRNDDAAGLVEFPFRELPALGPWTPALHEVAAPSPLPDLDYQAEIAPPAPATAAVVVTYPDASVETRFGWPDPGAAFVVEASYRLFSGGNPLPPVGMSEYRASSGVSMGHLPVSLAGQATQVRLRLFNDKEEGSHWSAWASLTPAVSAANPAAPVLAIEPDFEEMTALFTFTAPPDLNVARIELRQAVLPDPPVLVETLPCRPGQILTRTRALPSRTGSSQTARFTARAFSNGGQSALVTVDIIIPPL